ncbi:hypothetical protein Ancab_000195 [Ancistrocladus abbreviatus]
MDETSVSTSWERAKLLYDKNAELENKRRKSAQARVPSDPNAWYQMRENYEAIILEDHAFSEQHNIEYALWQLHYKRIEEFRAHFSAAQVSGRAAVSAGARNPAQPDRVTKIRVQFKAFLSEATGFYHDLILKIRAKYGLPLGHFSDDSDNIVTGRDAAKSSEVKKGIVSFHRCLIYLGDLARYKGLYGEGESRSRDYAAASSYYLQAATLLPSRGNPHHQLAILASYSGDELVAVYRYFRSLATEIPFATAKDNLIVAFEKNRHNYAQLRGKYTLSKGKESGGQSAAKGDAEKEGKFLSEDANKSTGVPSEYPPCIKDKYQEFCIQFVRLNGILFTRTSLEAFVEVLTSVGSALRELLSSGVEEERNFGADTAESGLSILRLVAILIFTVHNVNKKTEGLTYAEILQHTVLLQNAFTAAFELMGLMLERCLQLRDPSSSFLLPGILVFLEWMACSQDVVACNDVDEKPVVAKLLFWKHCVAFLNKILSEGLVFVDDDGDETCFSDMTRYEEGDSEGRFALWEDFELRGFLPLIPAQIILDFSKKHSVSFDGSNKEKRTRIKRIIAAGKALVRVIMVDQLPVHFDSKLKRFVVGVEPNISSNTMPSSEFRVSEMHVAEQEKGTLNLGVMQAETQFSYEGEEEEEEEIVFKPTQTDMQTDTKGLDLEWASREGVDVHFQQASSDARSILSVPAGNSASQPHKLMDLPNVSWLVDQHIPLPNGSFNMGFVENGHTMEPGTKGAFVLSDLASFLPPIQQSANVNAPVYSDHMRTLDVGMQPRADPFAHSEANTSSLAMKMAPTISAVSKSLVNRPVRHLGPPPGFSSVPSKQINIPVSSSDGRSESLLTDEYGLSHGYQLPSMANNMGPRKHINHASHDETRFVNSSNILTGTTSFPFPGKQVSALQLQGACLKGYQVYQPFENLNLNHDHKLPEQQNIGMRDQQLTPLPEHYQGQTTWTGRYLV